MNPYRPLPLVVAALLSTLFGFGIAGQQPPARTPDIHFVPTPQPVADAMLKLARVTPNDVVYDLGSGDGRIVILAAQKYGARGVGIELDPRLVDISRQVAREGGVADRVTFVQGDLFAADISRATVVTLWLSNSVNMRLEAKLKRELRPGARIVSHQFPIGTWAPDEKIRAEGKDVFLWTIPAASRANVAGAPAVDWQSQTSGVTGRLRGVSAVSSKVAWASGANGTVLRTTDGGRNWQGRPVPGGDTLDFRDIDAMSDRVAYALSIGNGESSRIYKTTDGGAHWDLQFVNKDPKVFLDAMAFRDAVHGVAFSDSVDGQFVILTTANGGRTWERVPADRLPPALPGEGAFAASGTNVAVFGRDHVWIGTTASRVLRSSDGARTWKVATTPLATGTATGIFSIAFRDARHGIVGGGNYQKESEALDNAAVTSDGGATWTLVEDAGDRGLSGFRSVVAWLPGATRALIAIGPSGADWSSDEGRTWAPVQAEGFDAFSVAPDGAGWAAGQGGRISKLRLPAAR